MSSFYSKWRQFLKEAQRDAKILRKINVDRIKKEMPPFPGEEQAEYRKRIDGLERSPEYLNPIFPTGLVDWMESLPDNHFPRDGRKRFAKWLGNAVYKHETETMNNLSSVDNPEELQIHNNDIRYISDYLNGSQEFPEDLWEKSLNGMFDLAVNWPRQLAAGIVGKEELAPGKLNYVGKKVVYKFENGYSMVEVDPKEGERDYTKEEGLRCGWAHDEEEKKEFHKYYDEKGIPYNRRPNLEIRSSINDLDIEGCAMGHCVGGYCDVVSSGRIVIYSLRDPKNEPHATIEVTPTLPLGRTRSRGTVDQIKGNGNAPPIEKYRPMIKQWLQTTDFEYERSEDYLNILSEEEIRERLFTGKLDADTERSLARSTENPEIIKFFLSQILAAGYTFGGTDITRVTKLGAPDLAGTLVRNDNLSEDHRLSLVKINFQLRQPVLGLRMALLIGARGITPNQDFDPASLSSRIWEELGDELTKGYDDEKLYCMQSLMEVDEVSDSIREDIINHLLSDEYIEGAVKQNPNVLSSQQQPYGSILQAYLFQRSPKPEQVKRLYLVQRGDKFVEVIGAIGRINGYIASSRGMTDDLADEIIEDVKAEESYAFMSRNLIDMILNPRISDSKKIELLNIGQLGISIVSLTQPQAGRGLKYHISGKSYSRQLYEAAREKKFSKKLVKYMIDAGVFNPQYVNVWVGQRTKMTGSRPNIENYDEDRKQDLLNLVRSRQIEEFESGIFDEDLFEEMNNYFRKNMMTKNTFYDNIKEQIGIKEEKGRSRQRGIYKFYCMISYSLTSEPEKSRGLDDILADLRALPNVTIVTVAIRNQKVAEGRYIAGLSIKFIPSTPGDFNTPENVKARIVKDIKRLANVQSLFKLSSGLIRLE